ncbi:ATP-binding protein [Microbacterium karelineae]|uniref:ATP-binding protein n=1 Tax=Microbacterium karelineae TaxID=2654283 RepID=UPI0012EAAB46|nr:hypothetical protein [Microbacterium karelineae]
MAAVTAASGDDSTVRTREPRSNSLPADERWIASSLAHAMRWAQLVGLVLVQLVLLITALVSTLDVPNIAAVLVAGGVVAAGAAVLVLRAHALVLIVTFYPALGFYYVVAVDPSEPLFSALIPLTAWSVILPIMLRAGAWPIIVSGGLALTCATVIVYAHPDWDRSVMSQSLATNIILVVNAAVFIWFLRRVATRFDRQKRAAFEEEARAVRRRASKDAAAEYVRVLHDTIVNTFGALAREGTLEANALDARSRCRGDLERIRSFQRGSSAGRRHRPSLTDLEHVGLPVNWTGIAGDDLRRFQALLPLPVLDALCGCAAEVVLNATKHSGAEVVDVDVEYADDVLRVTISDDGRGFERKGVRERGIADSLFARGESYGIAVALDSAIGEGTKVSLVYPLGLAAADDREGHSGPLRHFTRVMTVAWAVHAVAIGVSLEIVRSGGGSLLSYGLLAVLVVFAGMVWVVSRRDGRHPLWLISLMLAAIPALNLCALASFGQGVDGPDLLQAVSLTVVPVLLHASSRSFAPFYIAISLQIASMVIIGVFFIAPGPQQYSDVILLEAPTAALLVIWYVLLLKFRSIDLEIADSHHSTARALREAAAHEAAAEVQVQWSAFGLRDSFQLLQEIADGVVSSSDPETRRRCGDEEAFLRQISALAQADTLITRWFALGLAEARRRRIRLELHAEDAHVDDVDQAEEFGRLMLDCIAASVENSTLYVTLLQRQANVQMLIVGSSTGGLADPLRERAREHVRVSTEELKGVVLVEATLADPAP